MRKCATLLLITFLVVSSLVMVGSAFAESVPKPSTPEFTVKFVNASYTITTTNSYTGVDETELVCNDSIEITINNQPFDHSGVQIYYNVRVKPRFEDDWTEVYPLGNGTSSRSGDGGFSYALYINHDSTPQSESSCTIIAFPVVPTDLYLASGYDIQRYYSGSEGQEGNTFAFLSAIPDSGQVDFQIQALVGHDSQRWVIDHPLYPTIGGHFAPAVAYDGESDWSDTQTITIGESQTSTPEPTTQTSPTPNPHEEPQQIGREAILGIVVTVAVISVGLGLLLYLIKRK